MPKRWIERANLRTREAYCPDDERGVDPILCWTGGSWIPVPGRQVAAVWCRKEDREVSLEGTETVEREERKGPVTYALCPSCGERVAKRNRWRYWEPLFASPEEQADPTP